MNTQATENLIVAFILRLALVIFAIYGVTYLAPRVGQVLSERLIRATKVEGKAGL